MSSKKTTNYGLHLWESTDNFLRTEFNENSAKIDAALAALNAKPGHTLLFDKTATAQQTKLSAPLTGIDLTAWHALEFHFFIAKGAEKVEFVLNDPSDRNYEYTLSQEAAVKTTTLGNGWWHTGFINMVFTIPLYYTTDFVTMEFSVVSENGSFQGYRHGLTGALNVPLSSLRTIDAVGTIPANSRARIWGIT